MLARVSFLALVLALAVALPVGAQHCTQPYAEDALVDLGGQYYVDGEVCQPDCILDVWVYEESNGFPGLQSGEGNCHMIVSDTIVF